MNRVTVKVLGCGDAFGSGGRLQACFCLDSGSERILVDCGATAMVAMHQQGIDPATIDAVVISHLHGDHFGGIPLLLLEAQYVSRRDRPLTIAGPPGTRERLRHMMEAMYPGSSKTDWRFPITYLELSAGQRDHVGSVSVLPVEVDHPSGAPAFAFRLGCEDQVIAYSGDTEWTETLSAVADGADLLIMECFGFEQACKSHMNYQTVCARLPDLRARRIVLTHLSQEMIDRLDRVALETAYDGMTIDLSAIPAQASARTGKMATFG